MKSLISSNGNYPWHVLLVLMLGVLLPTICVLWFMTEAMKNENLAVHQKLSEFYHERIITLRDDWEDHWKKKIVKLNDINYRQASNEIFADIINKEIASSIILYDRNGRLTYPKLNERTTKKKTSTLWKKAQKLEYQENNPDAAADILFKLSKQISDVSFQAQTYQALARCLNKAGKPDAALKILTDRLMDNRFYNTLDSRGNLLQVNAQLRVLQLLSATQSNQKKEISDKLYKRVSDYTDKLFSSNQRLFLMNELQPYLQSKQIFTTFDAERIAIRYLENEKLKKLPINYFQLHNTQQPNIWKLSSKDNRVIALFTLRDINREFEVIMQKLSSNKNIYFKLIPPINYQETSQNETVILESILVGNFMPGWQLNLYLEDQSLASSTVKEKIAAYLWTGILIIISITILAVIIARYIWKQIKLNKLKNDLIATVSHEFKTPLSSMRLLVDTLLEKENPSEKETQDYLKLIAKENLRLSHLIDNFLAFSRMERGKELFEFSKIDIARVVNAALEINSEKLQSAGFKLDINIADNLPKITADEDMLVTVLINLLDNAYKYSAQNKQIIISAYLKDKYICLEVQDNGIGLSRADTKKIFNRFYRVDQVLTRETEGCGLGLNIVDYIVKNHNGKITVKSQLGRGSQFIVHLQLLNTK